MKEKAMSTYRPGYIEGKVKAGFYIDPEVQRALKIRAAQTGESMSEIAERALRKELGLMMDRATERLARELFAVYRRNLAASLECGEDDLPTITARLAGEDFETLAVVQNASEEAAWAEVRRADPEWPRAGSDEEAAVADAFRRLRYEAGY